MKCHHWTPPSLLHAPIQWKSTLIQIKDPDPLLNRHLNLSILLDCAESKLNKVLLPIIKPTINVGRSCPALSSFFLRFYWTSLKFDIAILLQLFKQPIYRSCNIHSIINTFCKAAVSIFNSFSIILFDSYITFIWCQKNCEVLLMNTSIGPMLFWWLPCHAILHKMMNCSGISCCIVF